jgi:hypothetical protein
MFSAWFSSVCRHVGSRPFRTPSSTGPDVAHRRWAKGAMLTTPILAVVLVGAAFVPGASAATTVNLGTATPFAVLAYSEVTDVPISSITGDVGLSPAAGTAYAGLTQAEVHGSIYSTDGTGPTGNVDDPALLTSAKADLTTAFGDAAGQSPTTTFSGVDNQLGGQTLTAGVYAFGHASTANITAASPLVLNGNGNLNSVFIFQASSDLVTGVGSVVRLENSAQACHVFWVVGSSATLDSSSTFVGTIMALTSVSLDSQATVQGRVLARNGAVTLDANTITAPTTCLTSSPVTTTTAPTTATTAPTTATTVPTTGTGASGAAGGGAAGTAGSIVSSGSTMSGGEANSGTGSAAGSGGSTTVVPSGFPHTGLGGASHSRDDGLLALGGLALLSAGGVVVAAYRRRLSLRRTQTPRVS